ncbi:hypothetical protein B0T14DRAFT_597105 [Immersiella caudata]|uniref:Uncharacterized protein n=1 Tax=Immersiella caudata TaxID=314043 RepID=A0AA39XCL5_9PEZI|nr:hypothetical protein B0T14DRAFT_597105 [Immersiella caudata]
MLRRLPSAVCRAPAQQTLPAHNLPAVAMAEHDRNFSFRDGAWRKRTQPSVIVLTDDDDDEDAHVAAPDPAHVDGNAEGLRIKNDSSRVEKDLRHIQPLPVKAENAHSPADIGQPRTNYRNAATQISLRLKAEFSEVDIYENDSDGERHSSDHKERDVGPAENLESADDMEYGYNGEQEEAMEPQGANAAPAKPPRFDHTDAYQPVTDDERDELVALYKEFHGSLSQLRHHLEGLTFSQASLLRYQWRQLVILAEAHNAGQITLKKRHKKTIEVGRERIRQGLNPFKGGEWPDPIQQPPVLRHSSTWD